MKHIFIIISLILLCADLAGQNATENLAGKVSFISSQNIYVKFKSTEGISPGDTLFISSNGNMVPVLIVSNLSSTSCVCSAVPGITLAESDLIIARIKTPVARTGDTDKDNALKVNPVRDVQAVSEVKKAIPDELKQRIRGSISAASYSDFSNTAAKNSNRFRYTFSLDARNIANSKFSIDIYTSFKHKAGDWSDVKSNVFNALKIYSLAVNYDLNKSTRISLGRKINDNISSIGAMDGLQFEKKINKFSFGAVAGTRPDYATYGFDSKLFQYGVWAAFNTAATESYTRSSLAFMQQTNNSKTDRRFLYFQHSSSIIKNLSFFSTFEIDLYKLKNDLPKSTFDLTALYLSLRYRMSQKFSLTASCDARKNVMYYETYKTFIDRILETEMRQSVRLQADYRITNNILTGVQSGYSLLKSDPHPSGNIYGYLSYNHISGSNFTVRLTGNYLESSYMKSTILGLNISREFFNGKFQADAGYNYNNYRLPESFQKVVQNIGELNLYWQVAKNLSLSVNGEVVFEKKDQNKRIYLQIRKRF